MGTVPLSCYTLYILFGFATALCVLHVLSVPPMRHVPLSCGLCTTSACCLALLQRVCLVCLHVLSGQAHRCFAMCVILHITVMLQYMYVQYVPHTVCEFRGVNQHAMEALQALLHPPWHGLSPTWASCNLARFDFGSEVHWFCLVACVGK